MRMRIRIFVTSLIYIVAPALKLWDSRRIWSRVESGRESRRIERRPLTTGILINPESLLFSSGLLTKQTLYDRLYPFTNKLEFFCKAVSLISRERRRTTRVREWECASERFPPWKRNNIYIYIYIFIYLFTACKSRHRWQTSHVTVGILYVWFEALRKN